ncbi:MAG: hypothetical protein LJE59_00520 [Chromatiaceae bacterium]|nr:hypothetical protein [Chromatiaceae bacterium]
MLESDKAKGLDMFEVGHRQKRFGPNRLTLKEGKSPLIVFLCEFHQPLIYIPLGAVIVTFALRE